MIPLLLIIAAMIFLIVTLVLRVFRKIPSDDVRIENWARGYGFKILKVERKVFFTGPFSGRRRGAGKVYRIGVHDIDTDKVRWCWVSLHTAPWGDTSEEVIWS